MKFIYPVSMPANSDKNTIERLLISQPPCFSPAEAVSIAAENYGIHAQVQPLVSERDQNFRLDAEDGKRYTLKISNHAEQLTVVDFQNRALQHVEEQDASLPLPRVIADLAGQLHCTVSVGGKKHFIRVLSWLDGRILHDTVANADLSYRLGRLLARLGLALKDFEHPGSNPPSLWDMKRAAGLRDLLVYIENPEIRQLTKQVLDRFVATVEPVLHTLRTQVIHSDMNLGNVLMDKTSPAQISGLIDFGDIVKSPLIMDLAIAAAYQLGDDSDPLDSTLPMIAGYHSIRPLQDIEMELLVDLIRTRLITSLLIGSYRVTLFPENREYLTISHQPAIKALDRLAHLDAKKALRRIREACLT